MKLSTALSILISHQKHAPRDITVAVREIIKHIEQRSKKDRLPDHECDEVVQEILSKLTRLRKTFVFEEELQKYVNRMITYAIIDIHRARTRDLRRYTPLDGPMNGPDPQESEAPHNSALPDNDVTAEEQLIEEEEKREERAELFGWLVLFFVYAARIEQLQGAPGRKGRKTFVEMLLLLLHLKASEVSINTCAEELGLKRNTLEQRFTRVRETLIHEESFLGFCISHRLPLQQIPIFHNFLYELLYF